MAEKATHIPEEVYLDFLGRTIHINWDYHALLMFSIWIVLVPLCITIIRYGKPRPTEFGIRRKVSLWHPEWWWFNTHKFGLYFAVLLSLGGAAVALVVSKGFSGSMHSILGLTTILLGCLQVLSGMLRGTHGGKYYNNADPNDPATWRGDHYDHTLRRRIFEAYHKTTGFFTLFCATGAVASGLMQFPFPALLWSLFIIPFVFLLVWVILEFLERRYDGYRAAHGYNMEAPYNKAREFL
ncbi:MAG: hypothetical protein D6754_00750 [Alphaproteobacteria bacterium]|nr:MAG: hypothetical protein D6754_00750 [Alphaproteobacteria bacterium]